MLIKKSLGNPEADAALSAMRQLLATRSKAAVLAVADDGGELIALVRLDGAPPASILIASNKAWTAAREGKPSRKIGQDSRDPKSGFDVAYFGDHRYIGWGGGLPVIVDGDVLGAVAVSGLSEDEDEEIARAGIAAILKLPPERD